MSAVGFKVRLDRGARLEIVCIVLVPRLQPCRSYPGEGRWDEGPTNIVKHNKEWSKLLQTADPFKILCAVPRSLEVSRHSAQGTHSPMLHVAKQRFL
jgi:hypothetical protein